MKKVDWVQKAKLIPAEIQIGPKTFYKICWVKEFPSDHRQVGEMDANNKHIYLKTSQSAKEKVLTYLHEVTHAISDENQLKLTENQVSILEKKAFYYLLKPENLFKKG